MDTQAVFLDGGARPRRGHKLCLADDVAGLPDQCEQNVECSTRQLQGAPVSLNPPLRGVEPKRPEDQDLPGGFVLGGAAGSGHRVAALRVVALPAGGHWEFQPGARLVTFYDLEAHQDA
ncbi:hypothetical protein [Bradyrhizobium diazoefficiens]